MLAFEGSHCHELQECMMMLWVMGNLKWGGIVWVHSLPSFFQEGWFQAAVPTLFRRLTSKALGTTGKWCLGHLLELKHQLMLFVKELRQKIATDFGWSSYFIEPVEILTSNSTWSTKNRKNVPPRETEGKHSLRESKSKLPGLASGEKCCDIYFFPPSAWKNWNRRRRRTAEEEFSCVWFMQVYTRWQQVLISFWSSVDCLILRHTAFPFSWKVAGWTQLGMEVFQWTFHATLIASVLH